MDDGASALSAPLSTVADAFPLVTRVATPQSCSPSHSHPIGMHSCERRHSNCPASQLELVATRLDREGWNGKNRIEQTNKNLTQRRRGSNCKQNCPPQQPDGREAPKGHFRWSCAGRRRRQRWMFVLHEDLPHHLGGGDSARVWNGTTIERPFNQSH